MFHQREPRMAFLNLAQEERVLLPQLALLLELPLQELVLLLLPRSLELLPQVLHQLVLVLRLHPHFVCNNVFKIAFSLSPSAGAALARLSSVTPFRRLLQFPRHYCLR